MSGMLTTVPQAAADPNASRTKRNAAKTESTNSA